MTYDYLQLNKGSDVPLYQQLYTSIREAVESGHLRKGERLPSVRRLSEDLALSCTTVESAYQQLCVEGYLRNEPRRGYFAQDARRNAPPGEAGRPAGALPRPDLSVRYNFGTDCVDSANMDLKIWRRHIRDALNRQNVIASYGSPQGEPELREALSSYSYGVRGVLVPPERIVIGAGTQPLLSILCGLLGQETRTVAMEEPGFLQAEQVFRDFGISVLKLPGDRDGIRMDALRASGAKLLYVSPSNRVTTGTSIPMSRRFELLQWAQESGGVLIEDDHNGELRYRARPIPAMQGVGGGKSVVYIGSFSKLLLPSVRIGYMALTPELQARYLPRARSYNQTASKIEQLALAGYIKSGHLERHLRRLRKLYGAKSEKLMKSLKSVFGSGMEILLQETPLTLILTVPAGHSAGELCRLALEEGVRVQQADSGKIRLGFAGIPINDIDAAVACLRKAWTDIGF